MCDGHRHWKQRPFPSSPGHSSAAHRLPFSHPSEFVEPHDPSRFLLPSSQGPLPFSSGAVPPFHQRKTPHDENRTSQFPPSPLPRFPPGEEAHKSFVSKEASSRRDGR